MWGDPGDLTCLEEAAAAAAVTAASYPANVLRRASAETHSECAAEAEGADAAGRLGRRQVATTGGAPAPAAHLPAGSVWQQRSAGGLAPHLTPQPSPVKPTAAVNLARSLPGSRLPSRKFGAASEALAAAASSSLPKEFSPDRLKGALSRRTSGDNSKPPAARSQQGQPAPQLRLQSSGEGAPPLSSSSSTAAGAVGAAAAVDVQGAGAAPSRLSGDAEDEPGSSVVAPWKAKVNWTLMFGERPLSVPSPLKLPLHEKLLSPGRRRSPQETKQASDERHARAGRLREALAEQRQARLEKRKQKEQAAKTMQVRGAQGSWDAVDAGKGEGRCEQSGSAWEGLGGRLLYLVAHV